jgi:hypothetical protein
MPVSKAKSSRAAATAQWTAAATREDFAFDTGMDAPAGSGRFGTTALEAE